MKALLLDILFALSRPDTWIRIYPFDAEWDKYFNELMDNHPFIYHSSCVAELGGTKIWVTSHPFGSFRPLTWVGGQVLRPADFMPSRRTVARAHAKLKEEVPDLVEPLFFS